MAKLTTNTKAEALKAHMTAQRGDRSPIVGTADPFAEYSLTDFMDEVSIVEQAGKLWGRQFFQVATGYKQRGGGAWASCSDGKVTSIVLPEKFQGSSSDLPWVNFWYFHLRDAMVAAGDLEVPLVILAEFKDGLFVLTGMQKVAPTVGTRIRKGTSYADVTNLIVTFEMKDFKQILRREV